ncbi:UvrD-helicase domain-containing protein [Flavobacterium sp. 2]|uniref:UvrD-helicase domain-containing protein n=1 Tax=Flavobacterium sp. 2 TaxID=308053 RepID=UPI000C1A2FB5|nr:UvrD-helicase domain-containing protein [Flavobacterium sp. 2]PIF71303.1 AAA domain-containing protein [Flavobacterium sp. 2]
MIELIKDIAFTEEEIEVIENLFFEGTSVFNDEQANVINCFSSQNIQACPGSGKTTTLAAKLLLLKKNLSSKHDGGVCILTHTNVAVDIIKKRLGTQASDYYSSYPNFLGTIQSFVNKFLAMPAYKSIFKNQLTAIDDDVFYAVMAKKQHRAYKAMMYLSVNKGIDNLGALSFNIHNFDISAKVDDSAPVVGKHTPSYLELEVIKTEMLEEGFMKFDEAYSLAYRYLREHDSLVNLFSKRFPLVFLDEMQDTEEHQFELIKIIFATSVLQTIGDGNQDIFGHYESISANWPVSESFSIATSSRFPNHIAMILQKIAVEPQSVRGRNEGAFIKPCIFIFDDNSVGRVKYEFVERIVENGLHQKKDAVFKAVGARKNNDGLSITSYLADFNKNSEKVKTYYPTLDDYLNAMDIIKNSSKNAKDLKDLLVSVFVSVLKLMKVKDQEKNRYFTSFSLERFLKINHSDFYVHYRKLLQKWCKDIMQGVGIKASVNQLISLLLERIFEDVPNQEVLHFMEAVNEGFIYNNGTDKKNIFQGQHKNETVEIIFDTIHSVKGETHTATLYLETFTRTYDLSKLLPLLNGKQNRTKTYVTNNRNRMKLGYVAMSRPTDFLCLAVHKDRIDMNIDWNLLGYETVVCY